MTQNLTPGPWMVSGPDDTMVINADREVVCTTYQGVDDYEENYERRESDARLIAAAPELLEALKLCQEYLKYSLGSTSSVNPYPAMDAVIARVEG